MSEVLLFQYYCLNIISYCFHAFNTVVLLEKLAKLEYNKLEEYKHREKWTENWRLLLWFFRGVLTHARR